LSDITARIRRVTEDLQVLHRYLDAAARDATERTEVVDEVLDGGLMNDLKAAVDNVRHFLWSYIEATTQDPADLRSALQGYRMQRVTEMLRVLRENDSELGRSPLAHSFFEEINSIADRAIERYNPADAKPKGAGK
jgi:hypothetical protein